MKPPPARPKKPPATPREKRAPKPRAPQKRAGPPKTAKEARERETALHERWAEAKRQRDEIRGGGDEPSEKVLKRVLSLHHRWRAMAKVRTALETAEKRAAWAERNEPPPITAWPYALPRPPAPPSRDALKIAEQAAATEEAEIRARMSHGLSIDRRTAAGQRELEREDARRVALNGRRHPIKDRHDRLFHERRQDHTPARVVAAERFDDAYHEEHLGLLRSPDYLQQKVDGSVRARSPIGGGSYTYGEMAKVVGPVDLIVLVKRICIGMRWDGIARDTNQTPRQAGIAYRDALQRIVQRFEITDGD